MLPDDAAGRLAEGVALLSASVEVLTGLAASGDLHDISATILARAERQVRALEHRLSAVRLSILPVVEDDGAWALDGSRSFPAWLARHDDVPRGVANRESRQARALRDDLPATLAAALAGTVGCDQVTAMVAACTTTARAAALATPVTGLPTRLDDAPVAPPPTGEEFLLAQAALHPISGFQRLVRHFAHVADPDADDRGYRGAVEREYLELSLTLGGYHVSGFLTEVHGAALRTALDAVAGAPAADDERTPTQRRAQALADLARLALDNGMVGTGAAVRPHLNVTVSWTELQRQLGVDGDARRAGRSSAATGPAGSARSAGAPRAPRAPRAPGAPGAPGGAGPDCRGWTESVDPGPVGGSTRDDDLSRLLALDRTPAVLEGSTGPLPATVLRAIACDSEITRIVFGPDGQVLNVGRAQRTITGQLRRAVIARDRHCTYPGCDQPPSRCDVHHAERHWAAHHGETSTANAALLCWHHHSLVDTTSITMRWRAPASGSTAGWEFTDRHGRRIEHRPWRSGEGRRT
ncbi:HNH endonuclease [Xylanimonas allomyrinae]|uniref:HNH endonuclease n=2 Tax=Xylanimonas allomyrinae TaxID=2509459 RepID=A0A4P6EQ12_9MICO|nr:HNH endonuclease [Xylanimonas allomyrinae]